MSSIDRPQATAPVREPTREHPLSFRTRLVRGVLRLVERRHGVLIALLLASFAALFGTVLAEWRKEIGERAAASAENLLRSIGEDVARSIANYRDTFDILAAELVGAEHNRLAGGHEHVAVGAHAALIRSTGDLFLFDAAGAIQERSARFNGREALRHREFLEAHRADASAQMRIGAPFRDPSSGNTVLWISRRLNKPDGSFAGVLAGTLDTGRWRQVFESFSIGPRSSINLFHADDTLMMRAPFVAGRIGENLAGTANFEHFAAAPAGSFVGLAALDREERSYHFARIPGTPLILNVAVATREIYAPWWKGSVAGGAILVVLAGLAVGLRLILTRELRLRRESEARYRALSDVDGLTGIANRRSFDEALAREWTRVATSGGTLSAIILDVDHFKRFNDAYGHQEGDDCLRSVASTLRKAVARSGDIVARYGGEEFVVLLPGADGDGALVVAERIRASVEARAIPHSGNPRAGVVTLSLGIASAGATDARNGSPALLVSAADQALYRAKRTGRNRVERQLGLSGAAEPPILPGEVERAAEAERCERAVRAAGTGSFDELARLAAAALGAPAGFVSLIGSDRQALVGAEGSDIREAERAVTFCSHAIAGNGLFVVPDAAADPRFADNPFVTGDAKLRFYAGAPIVSAGSGHTLGAVCVFDTKPRDGVNPAQAGVLASLAEVAAERLEAASAGR